MINPDYSKIANEIRKTVLTMTNRAKSSHVGSSLSLVELLTVLYWGILRTKPLNPSWEERDRLILSKGHGCAALYAALAAKKNFPHHWLDTYYQNGGKLAGHVTHYGIPGIEVSAGSLGHGLPIGCGMAIAAKRDKKKYRVFVILSDGELDEGSNWEAILFAPHHKLDNLIVIIDYNKIQSLTFVKDTLNLEPLVQKWEAFGWAVKEIDGHNFDEIEKTLTQIPLIKGKPSCVIAHTIKGKGVSFMENDNLWHYRAPSDDELARALKELASP